MPAPTYAPPVIVDVTWCAAVDGTRVPFPDAVAGENLARHALGLYSMLARHVDLEHPERSDYDAVRRPGVGIPVYLGRPLAHLADELGSPQTSTTLRVVVALLDASAFDEHATYAPALQRLAALAADGAGPVLLLPVTFDARWDADVSTTTPTRASFYQPAECEARVRESVAVHLARWLMRRAAGTDESPHVKVFVSHAKADLEPTDKLAVDLNAYLRDHNLDTFFDAQQVPGGTDLAMALERGQRHAVMLSIRTDQYSESAWCTEELLTAKRLGVPTLTLWRVDREERRASPYSGNGPILVWRDGREDEVVARCLQAWLQHLYFQRKGPVMLALADISRERAVISRPPELIDFAQGTLPVDGDYVVLYPDPPMSTVEAQVLRRAQPRVRLATPTTLFAGAVVRDDPAPPLAGRVIALSMSDSPDAPRLSGAGAGANAAGYTELHVKDAIARITLSLIRAGAGVGYGGRLGDDGFTPFLAETVAAHNRLGAMRAEMPRLYVPNHRFAEPTKLSVEKIRCGQDLADGEARLAVQTLQLSVMRRDMAARCDARISFGGRVHNYEGRFPGHVEECWRMLTAPDGGKPIYVLGGFGGGARLVVDALLGRIPTSGWLDEARRRRDEPAWAAMVDEYDTHPGRLADTPKTLDDMGASLTEHGALLRTGKPTDLWTNKLTVAENLRLFETRDLDEISHLLMKGLTAALLPAARPDVRPALRLFHGSLAEVEGTEAYAVPVLRGLPNTGAGAALDRRLGGRIAAALRRGPIDRILEIDTGGAPLAGKRVFIVPLGSIDDLAHGRREQFEEACAALARTIHRADVRHLTTVPFGGTLGLPVALVVDYLLKALRHHAPQLASLTLCEVEAARYQQLEAATKAQKAVTLMAAPAAAVVSALAPAPVVLDIRRRGSWLTVTTIDPADDATATVISQEHELTAEQLVELDALVEGTKQGAPPTDLDQRAPSLLALLPPVAQRALQHHAARPVDLIVDPEAAAIPWEALTLPGPIKPSLAAGLRRRLLVSTNRDATVRKIAPGERLSVLLIVDPRRNLPAAGVEGKLVAEKLRTLDVNLDLELLEGPQATVANVLARLAERRWDVLHYAGHAKFDPDDRGGSGIRLADRRLVASDLQPDVLLPPLVVINACESSKVRGDDEPPEPPPPPRLPGTPPPSYDPGLAEAILSNGVRSFIGTFWAVHDSAAAKFSTELYDHLVGGATLGEAVIAARMALRDTVHWGNYALYGDTELRF